MSKRVTIAVLVVLLTGTALAVDWNRLATAGAGHGAELAGHLLAMGPLIEHSGHLVAMGPLIEHGG